MQQIEGVSSGGAAGLMKKVESAPEVKAAKAALETADAACDRIDVGLEGSRNDRIRLNNDLYTNLYASKASTLRAVGALGTAGFLAGSLVATLTGLVPGTLGPYGFIAFAGGVLAGPLTARLLGPHVLPGMADRELVKMLQAQRDPARACLEQTRERYDQAVKAASDRLYAAAGELQETAPSAPPQVRVEEGALTIGNVRLPRNTPALQP